MKKLIYLFLTLVLTSFLSSCGGDYAAEREMWFAQKEAGEILANPEATPPGQVEIVANRYRNIAQKYPDWPGKIRAQWSVAQLYVSQKAYKSAEEELEKIISQYRDNKEICAQAKVTIGSLYEIQKDWDKALRVYEEAIEKYPLTSQGLLISLYIANHYRVEKDYPKAKEAYLSAQERYKAVIESTTAPDMFKAFSRGLNLKTEFALATLYEAEEQWGKSLALLNKIKDEFPYSEEGLTIPLYIANHYQLRGETSEADRSFSEALSYYEELFQKHKKHPIGLLILNLKKTTYLNQKKWNEAIKVHQEIIKTYPNSPDTPLTLLNIALIYERELEDKDKAIASYQKVKEKFPKHRLAKVAEEKIEKLK